jgi:ankyrin repeat protein
MELISAIKENNLEEVTALLEKGANVYSKDRVTLGRYPCSLFSHSSVFLHPSLELLPFIGHVMKIIFLWLLSC